MRTVATALTPVPILSPSTTIQEASAAMLDERVEAAVVVDGGILCGLVTARDVADSLADHDVGSSLVVDIAGRDPLIVDSEQPLAEARSRMRAANRGVAVVIGDDARPLGVLADDATVV